MKNKYYDRVTKYLAAHKKLTVFLSHGGLHLVVLLVLVVTSFFLARSVYRSTIRNYVVLDMAIGCGGDCDSLMMTDLSIRVRPRGVNGNGDYSHGVTVSPTITDLSDSSVVVDRRVNVSYRFSFPLGGYKYRSDFNSPHDSVTVTRAKDGLDISMPAYWAGAVESTCNLFGNAKDSPFYTLRWRIDALPCDLGERSEITVLLDSVGGSSVSPITFDKIYPTPDVVGISSFAYRGKASVERVLREGGIYVEATDALRSIKSDRYELVYTVLLGTIIAFCLDIIIKLIYKWRNLRR